VEASTISAPAGLARPRVRAAVGPLLRLRSDEQLVRLFRTGSDEAFRVIHDRYRARLFAYARQMLAGSRQDAEDALQEVFVRAYGALRADDREISLRAWLYRVAHNRCVDELRRPAPPPPEAFELIRPPACDPIAAVEQRESLRRLVDDVRRLPGQQRSALLMREIVGMSYQDLAAALDVTVPAVKSLLVRARIGLAQAAEARDTACVAIRAELAGAHERGVRASGLARRHLHDCADCTAYRRELRSARERFAALTPALGPGALLAKLLGFGGGGAAAGGGAAGGAGGAAASGVGAVLGGGSVGVSAGHVAAMLAAAVVSAGGAVEVQQTLAPPHARAARPAALVRSQSTTATAFRLPTPQVRARVPSPLTPRPDATGTGTPSPPPLAAANGGAAAPVDPTTGPAAGAPLAPADGSTAADPGTSTATSSPAPAASDPKSSSTSEPPASGEDPAGGGDAVAQAPPTASTAGAPASAGSSSAAAGNTAPPAP
jgi:RNA polymerase sigma factor (sigma-70 family)